MLVLFYVVIGFMIVTISLALTWIIVSMVALFFTRVPYVNTPRGYCEKILEVIDVEGLKVYDLGCGDGYFLRRCENKKAQKCIGYELSPTAYFSASIKTLNKPISIRFGDFFKADISEADILYIYLVRTVLARLAPKLEAEAKSGSTIITIGSPLIGLAAQKVISLHGDYNAYVYKKE